MPLLYPTECKRVEIFISPRFSNSIDCRLKYRCAENSIHILCASVSNGFHYKSMHMLSQASMYLALLLIWASMWPIKVFDVYAISLCNWSRWVGVFLISLWSIDLGLKIPLPLHWIQGSNLLFNWSATKDENNNYAQWDGIARMQFKSKVSDLLGMSTECTTNYNHRFNQYSRQCQTFYSSWFCNRFVIPYKLIRSQGF